MNVLLNTLTQCNKQSFLSMSESEYLALQGCDTKSMIVDCLKKNGPELSLQGMRKYGIRGGDIELCSFLFDLRREGKVIVRDAIKKEKNIQLYCLTEDVEQEETSEGNLF